MDFLITDKNIPKILIEAKSNDSDANRTLLKFQFQLDIPAIQLVNKDNVCKLITNNSQNYSSSPPTDGWPVFLNRETDGSGIHRRF